MPVYLIRHGQSEFNAAFNTTGKDPMIFDAPLTEHGRKQAEQARELVRDLDIKHVITSPLTRAIQTALCIFGDTLPIAVASGHRELLLHSCDVGRPPEDLRRDFPMLSFDHLPDRWWHHDPHTDDRIDVEPEKVFRQRISEFDTGLTEIKQRPLAIVGHGNAFQAMIGRMLDNCEIHLHQKDEA